MTAGTAPTVDIHAHFYPSACLDLLAGRGYPRGTVHATGVPGAAGARRYAVHDAAFSDIALRLDRMDRQRVRVHALSLPPPDAFAFEPALHEALCRAFNDAASAAHRRHPERLIALAALPVHAPDAAAVELERARRLPGVRGVCLGTRFHERELSDPAFFPLWERLAAAGLPVFLHYAPLMVVGTPERLHAYHLGNVIGNTTETAIAAAHLVFGGVLDRLPALEVCLPHGGGTLPVLFGRLDRAWQTREECRHLPHPPSHYARRFRYDTVCHSGAVFDFLVRVAGADRLMLGSDYCFDMSVDEPRGIVENATLDDAARAGILGANAAGLLGLD
ncbi:MAG: amidohydrolase family protein [Burkholderiales bacterium]|nr:amidohydrolase family protein [Burkholderiales bacterium]